MQNVIAAALGVAQNFGAEFLVHQDAGPVSGGTPAATAAVAVVNHLLAGRDDGDLLGVIGS